MNICEVYELIITSIFWADVGLNIDAKGEVVCFIYKDESGPRSGNLPEAVVVQFHGLYIFLKISF